MATNKLTTKADVKGLTIPVKGNKIYYDNKVRGFGCRVTAAAARAFVLNYRRRSDGLERRYTIGSFPDWTPTAAREKAKELKRDIDAGGDPVGKIETERAAPTFSDLCDRFIAEYLPRKRPSTQHAYRLQIDNLIRPALGRMKVAGISFSDIDKLHREITANGTPIHANRILSLVSRMLAMAVRWKMRADNPGRGIERNTESKRRRYLSKDELARLTQVLAKYPDQQVADIVRLLLLTGARRGEVLHAKWEQFDLDGGIWTKPGATTKQKTDHIVPLSAPARELLSKLRRKRSGDYLFPGRLGEHRLDIKNSWKVICRSAGITGLRVHDLRHAFASFLVSDGISLPIIGRLLGHTQPATTARYAHLHDDPLRLATEKVGRLYVVSGGRR